MLDNLDEASDARGACARIAGAREGRAVGQHDGRRVSPPWRRSGADYVSVGAMTHSAPARGHRARWSDSQAADEHPVRVDPVPAIAAARDRAADARPLHLRYAERRSRPTTSLCARARGRARRHVRPRRPAACRAAGGAGARGSRRRAPDCIFVDRCVRRRRRRCPCSRWAPEWPSRTALTRATGLPVELKWPNDLVIGRPWRKLGGVLSEAAASGRRSTPWWWASA